MERYHLYEWLTGHLFVVDCSKENLSERNITYYSTNVHGQVLFEKSEVYKIKSKLRYILKRMSKPQPIKDTRVSDNYVYHYLLTEEEKIGLVFRPSKSIEEGRIMSSSDFDEIKRKMIIWAWENECCYPDPDRKKLEYAKQYL